MIPLRIHNILDYVIGAVLIVCPFLFGFSDVQAARNVFVILGAALIVYSSVTNYRYSLFKWIPLGVHMTMDALIGIALVLAPSIFNYRAFLSGTQFALHVILGVGAVGLVALTRPRVGMRTEAPVTR